MPRDLPERVMTLLDALRFVDPHGNPFSIGNDLRIVESIKGDEHDTRQLLHVTCDKHAFAIKIDRLHSISKRLGATLGRSPLTNERHMLSKAAQAGLPVVSLAAYANHRRGGFIAVQATITHWLADHMPMQMRLINAAATGEMQTVEQIRTFMVDMTARIRRAGLADSDLGMHNVLIPADGHAVADSVWIDPEAAYLAAPSHAGGTTRTLAATLSNWWLCAGRDQQDMEQTFTLLREAVPEPDGGWRAIVEPLNNAIADKLAKFIRNGRIDRLPESITWRNS